MSCQPCDDRQDAGEKIYYRWGKANVEINACDEHFNEIRAVLNDYQFISENEKVVPCMECKRTVPNSLMNAVLTDSEVADFCILCALKKRNKIMGKPEDTPFTGAIAKRMVEKTIEYYKKTNQA